MNIEIHLYLRVLILDVTGVILAGGEGKRFRPYTEIVPKPMIPIGWPEKPVLEYIVEWMVKHGIKDIVLLVNYKWRYIANYFGDGSRYGARIRYCIDDEKYTNTGGALLKAYREGLLDETAFIWYGDILAPVPVKEILGFHEETGADAVLVITDRYKVPVGIAKLDEENNVVEMREKPELNIHATIGILSLKTRVLGEAEKSLGTRFDIMGELIPYMIRNGWKVKAYIYDGLWYDVGSLERYKKIDVNEIPELFGLKRKGS